MYALVFLSLPLAGGERTGAQLVKGVGEVGTSLTAAMPGDRRARVLKTETSTFH
jgi:hypothetical protein